MNVNTGISKIDAFEIIRILDFKPNNNVTANSD
jgi:hypothetical protein